MEQLHCVRRQTLSSHPSNMASLFLSAVWSLPAVQWGGSLGKHGSTNGNGKGDGDRGVRIWFRAREALFLTCTGLQDRNKSQWTAGVWGNQQERTYSLPSPPKNRTTWTLKLRRSTVPTFPSTTRHDMETARPRDIWELCLSSQCSWASNQSRCTPFMPYFQLFYSYFFICLLADLVVCRLLSWVWGPLLMAL